MIQHVAEEGCILLFDVWMVNCWLLSSYVVAWQILCVITRQELLINIAAYFPPLRWPRSYSTRLCGAIHHIIGLDGNILHVLWLVHWLGFMFIISVQFHYLFFLNLDSSLKMVQAENFNNNLDHWNVQWCEPAGKLICVGVNDNLCEWHEYKLQPREVVVCLLMIAAT